MPCRRIQLLCSTKQPTATMQVRKSHFTCARDRLLQNAGIPEQWNNQPVNMKQQHNTQQYNGMPSTQAEILFTFDPAACNRNRQYPIPYQEKHNGYGQVHNNTYPRWPCTVVNKFTQKQPEQILYHFGTDDKLKEHQVVLEVTDEFLFKRSKPPICVIHELEHHLCVSVGLDCRCNFDKSFPKQQTIHMHITGNNVTASAVATARNKREAKHIAACLMLNGLINSNLIQVFGTKEFIDQNSRTKLLYASNVFMCRKPNSAMDLEKLLKKKQAREPTAINARIPHWQYCQPKADQQAYCTRQNNNAYARPYQQPNDAQRLMAQRQSDYEKLTNTGHEHQPAQKAVINKQVVQPKVQSIAACKKISQHIFLSRRSRLTQKTLKAQDSFCCSARKANSVMCFQTPTVDSSKKVTDTQVQRQPQKEAVQAASQPSDDVEKAKKPSAAKVTAEIAGESDNEDDPKEQLVLYRKPKLPPSPSKRALYKRKKNDQDKQTKPKATNPL
ncbi:hypothetical protein D918_09056 [Trichuris suis]|nr:hypothetical protein D918_09056 [Trichuris suis]